MCRVAALTVVAAALMVVAAALMVVAAALMVVAAALMVANKIAKLLVSDAIYTTNGLFHGQIWKRHL